MDSTYYSLRSLFINYDRRGAVNSFKFSILSFNLKNIFNLKLKTRELKTGAKRLASPGSFDFKHFLRIQN